jgi:hypothetical protein
VLRKEERGGDRLVQSSTVFTKAGDWHRPVLKRGRNYTAIFSGKRREGESGTDSTKKVEESTDLYAQTRRGGD